MKVSIIIPSINRQKDLARLIESIKHQSVYPFELIVVEQGNTAKTKKVLKKAMLPFQHKVIYSKEASLTRARNKGVFISAGDIILFLDDDTQISTDYIETLLALFQQHKQVVALAGTFQIHGRKNGWFSKLIASFFCISKLQEHRNIVLRSGHNLMRAHNTQTPVYVEWVSGLNMAYRRQVFEDGLRFYEGFTKYSLGEDVFFSYSAFKKYGERAIMIHPALKLKHLESQTGRLHHVALLKMRIIYKYVFWKKMLSHKRLSGTCYILSELLLVPIYIWRAKQKVAAAKASVKTLLYLSKHKKEIVEQKIDYNSFIFS